MVVYSGSSAPIPAETSLRPLFGEQHPDGNGRLPIPCVYCRRGIEPGSFVFWSAARRLLSATCPDCHRRTTMGRATWARLSDPARLRQDHVPT